MPNYDIHIGCNAETMRKLGEELIAAADRRNPDATFGGECEHTVHAEYNGPGEVVLSFSNDDMEKDHPEGAVYVDVDAR